MAKYSCNVDTSKRQNFFCKISIDKIELIPQNIISCTIREWVFNVLPRIELLIMDDGVLSEAQPITDESIIHIELGNSDEDDELLDAEFNVHDYSIDVVSNKIHNISITGILKSNSLFFPIKNRAFANLTSVDVIKQIAAEINFKVHTSDGFSTSDLMTWLQINICNYDMIKHVIGHAFKPNDAILCYCGVDGVLYIKSLEAEAKKQNIINARYDISLFSSKTPAEQDAIKLSKNIKATDKSIWYNSYNLLNIMGTINKNIGYGKSYTFYNGNDKQRTTITNGTPMLVDTSPSVYKGQIVDNEIFGIQNTNTYDNFYKAKIQNDLIIATFFQQSVLLNISPINKVKLFDKISVFLNSVITTTKTEYNDVLSGEYLVGGITHNVAKGSTYKKQLSLHRMGTNKSTFKT